MFLTVVRTRKKVTQSRRLSSGWPDNLQTARTVCINLRISLLGLPLSYSNIATHEMPHIHRLSLNDLRGVVVQGVREQGI